MGTTYDQIIEVNISKGTTPIAVKGFSNILVFGKNFTFEERYKLITDQELGDVIAEITGGVDAPEYKAVASIFKQAIHPSTVILGKQESGETETEALDAILKETNDFYAVVYPAHDDKKAEAVADWVELNKKIFGYASDSIGFYSSPAGDSTSFLHYAKSNALERTMGIYSDDADKSFIEAAILALLLPKDAGTYTAAYKTLSGVAVDTLTGGQAKNIHDKNGSTYEEIGGKNVFLFGQMGSGDYLDLIVFVDVLKARIQEEIFGLKVRLDKVSFDDIGIAQIEQCLINVFERFQVTGAITEHNFNEDTKERTGGFMTKVPFASEVSLNDKANRVLKNVKFTVWYSGAIHTVKINGFVTL